jgi:chemotaxis response regulator CheB
MQESLFFVFWRRRGKDRLAENFPVFCTKLARSFQLAMEKRRVLLICSQNLFGESLEAVLRAADDVELLGPWDMQECICERIAQSHPHVVIIADENTQSIASIHLTTAILEQFPHLSVMCAGLSENVVRVFLTHLLPARGADLLGAIRSLPALEEMTTKEAADQ